MIKIVESGRIQSNLPNLNSVKTLRIQLPVFDLRWEGSNGSHFLIILEVTFRLRLYPEWSRAEFRIQLRWAKPRANSYGDSIEQ